MIYYIVPHVCCNLIKSTFEQALHASHFLDHLSEL